MNKTHPRLVWLPSAFTTISLVSGFAAIILAADASLPHHFWYVPLLVAVAVFCDGIDGRVARAVGACTEFGENFDSFADLTAFGIAPAFMVYQLYFTQVGVVGGVAVGGLLIAASFIFSNAFRLSRFATKAYNPRVFEGMATTVGGALVATLAFWGGTIPPLAAAITVLLTAFLMSSRIEFPKLSAILGRAPYMLKWSLLLALAVVLIPLWPAGLTLLMVAYALYSVLWATKRAARRRFRRVAPVAAAGLMSTPAGGQLAGLTTMTVTVDDEDDEDDEEDEEEDWDDDWEDEEDV